MNGKPLSNLERFVLTREEASDAGRYYADMWPEVAADESAESWLMAHSNAWLRSWSENACDSFRDAFRTAWAREWLRQHAA